jgi:hypothetical protein
LEVDEIAKFRITVYWFTTSSTNYVKCWSILQYNCTSKIYVDVGYRDSRTPPATVLQYGESSGYSFNYTLTRVTKTFTEWRHGLGAR